MRDPQVEKLADYAHRAWSGWMQYLFQHSIERLDGSVVIPKELAIRWKRQIQTPYEKLSLSEKESDRKEANEILSLIG